ncbi:TPA: tyrosine-protein kinase [Streptococcus suis]|uniref:tyrosine-protein kinase n=1 Tax=Streptococcus suis TaxID=1307 RepID=UPI0005CD237D|nr:tyrosine-protein kinase [Streptococcus suis]APZ78902.1 Tyrosine-protein kinase Wze [Streptococcus suis]APZ78924.1 Tyrosine-protein kinase Wze [Streptococcus suis]APZ78946.1 Tyrosine-protein kinase Wze [Streptococcus suis]MCK3870124.1 tyrosine-protein kinase [Streptococcus suis]MCK4031907.1 tyrosine-protein kinase [Streptococcus suis]
MAALEIARKKKELVNKTEEYFNAIRTNIQLSGADIKVVGITSVQSNEGKSTTAASLALAYARSGYKTVLVDADIRNSVVSGFFKPMTKITGLTDYLAGTTDLSQGLCDTDIPNLTAIESGKVSPNPTALLQSKNFENLLATLRRYYDCVIVDCPPLGLVIDAAIIAQKCDAMVLVAEAGNVKRSSLKKVKEQLDQTGTPFLGVILNKYDIATEKYGEYGNYGNYGKKA